MEGGITFSSCLDINAVGLVEQPQFGKLQAHVNGLKIQRGGETAITDSLILALSMLGSRGGRIVLITDGQETCSGDPCDIADAALAQNTVIDVVDMTGTAPVACLAEQTGGRLYRPKGAPDYSRMAAFVLSRLNNACNAPSGR